MCSVESLFIVDKEWIDKFEFSSSSELRRDGKYPPTLCDVIKAVAIIYHAFTSFTDSKGNKIIPLFLLIL